jgi:hypothetical protein
VLFVLDATTGQNGLTQAKAFHDAAGLTGVVWPSSTRRRAVASPLPSRTR